MVGTLLLHPCFARPLPVCAMVRRIASDGRYRNITPTKEVRSVALILAFVTLLISPTPPDEGGMHAADYSIAPLACFPQSLMPPADVAALQAGMNELASLDWDVHGDIQNHIANGTLEVSLILTPGIKGAADGSTIAVSLRDNPNATTIAVRLWHEYQHWKYGELSPYGHDGGYLTGCEHFDVWFGTMQHLANASCEPRVTISCSQLAHCAEQMAITAAACYAAGGSLVWPPWPSSCCF